MPQSAGANAAGARAPGTAHTVTVKPWQLDEVGDLPGADLVAKGFADLEQGRITVEAALVSIGAPRLRFAGLPVPNPLADPEELLYTLLEPSHGDGTHSAYNALLRRLVSFERALGPALRAVDASATSGNQPAVAVTCASDTAVRSEV